MIWFIILAVVVYILYRFLSALNKDNQELESLSLADKFGFLVDELNRRAFDSEAVVHMRDKRSFCLHLKGGNQIIEFFYSTGHLTIQWKFTFTVFGNEVIFERQINDVRSLEERSQIALANSILNDVENFFRLRVPDAVPYYSKVNKSGFLFKESHAILSEMREIILGREIDKNEEYKKEVEWFDLMDEENFDSDLEDDSTIEKKEILYDFNGNLINNQAYELYKSIENLIELLRVSLDGNNTVTLTKSGTILLYRDDLREKVEFKKINENDLRITWEYKGKINGEQFYSATVRDIVGESLEFVELYKLATAIRYEAEDELKKSFLDD